MKHFIITNWYKLTTATAMFIFACAFFVFALKDNVAIAGSNPLHKQTENPPANVWMLANDKGIYEITWDVVFSRYKCDKIFNENGQ